MKISKLSIQGFRGISNRIDLDLSAPLTIILAPNGTGKTSICDSVEWLISGSVDRLKNAEEEPLHCKFTTNETIVEAEIMVGTETLSLKRELDLDTSTLMRRFTDLKYKTAKELDILNYLVPDINIGRNSHSNMTSWLRATRFLESDSLNELIDRDKESHETRKLMFSNLFGVKTLQEKQKHLDKVKSDLGAESRYHKRLKDLDNEITKIENELKSLGSENSRSYFMAAIDFLNRVGKLINVSTTEASAANAQRVLSNLKVACIERTSKTTSDLKTVDLVNSNLELIDKNRRTIIDIDKRLTACEKELKEEEKELEKIRDLETGLSETSEHLYGRMEAHSTFNKWVSTNTKSIRVQIDKLSKELVLGTLKYVDSASIEHAIDLTDEQINKLRDSISEITECGRNAPKWIKLPAQLSKAELEQEKLEASIKEKRPKQPFEKQLSDLRSKLEELSLQRKAAYEEIDVILSSGHQFIFDNPQQTTCPLCDHDYKSHEALLQTVSEKLSRLSSESKEEASIQVTIRQVEKHSADYETLREKLSSLKENIRSLQEQIDYANDRLLAIGIKSQPSNLTELIIDFVKQQEAQTRTDLVGTEKLKSNLRQLLTSSETLERLAEGLDDIIRTHGNNLKIRCPNLKDLDKFENFITKIEEYLAGEIKDINEKLQKNTSHLKNTKSQIQKIQAKIDKINNTIEGESNQKASLESTNRSIQEKWEGISQEPLTVAEIRKFTQKLQNEKASLDQAGSLLKEAQISVDKALNVRQIEDMANRYKNDVSKLRKEKDVTARKLSYIKQLEEAINILQEQAHQVVKQQIDPLSDTISSLYLRAQGNQVISSIVAAPNEDGILDWVAELTNDGKKLNDMVVLSQGQRQDLALSIFLARARRLGGTFFLDEPLVHLDDLNRIALLDTIRVILTEQKSPDLNLVITTSSRNLVRHFREKFCLVQKGKIPLRMYQLSGSPKTETKAECVELPVIQNDSFKTFFHVN